MALDKARFVRVIAVGFMIMANAGATVISVLVRLCILNSRHLGYDIHSTLRLRVMKMV